MTRTETGAGAPRRRWVWVALAVYLAMVGAVLLLPVSYGGAVNAIGVVLSDGLGIGGFGTGWIEFTGNIVMFVPLGLLLTLLVRRHWLGVVFALALSAAAELAQAFIPSREPSLRDVLANVVGAAVGAALAWMAVLRRERNAASAGRSPNPIEGA
ncbi:VanZ family protein [Microbacterium sp. NPDC058021]|uniref:VanZ family protein n=1 Tax=Microbacterium sp. NPDC058021 TaxID=3346306 RepID=UPI0036DE8151